MCSRLKGRVPVEIFNEVKTICDDKVMNCTSVYKAGNTLEREPKSRYTELAWVGSPRLLNTKIVLQARTRVPQASLELILIRMCAASQLVRTERMSVTPNWIYPSTLSTNKPWLDGGSLWWVNSPQIGSSGACFSRLGVPYTVQCDLAWARAQMCSQLMLWV